MKEVIKLIEKHVSERMVDRHQGLNVLCDFLIDMFDYRHYLTPGGWVKNCVEQQQKEPYLFKIALIWMYKVSDAIERGSWLDFFGGVYEEMYQTRDKASTLGQFFTPPYLCDALARMIVYEGGRISDSACGSGRMLLAAWAEVNRRAEKGLKGEKDVQSYYVGDDIDTASVKMCALNLMIHGIRGRVVRHDTLKDPIAFDYGFEVNEVREPFPVPFYSLRRIASKAERATKVVEERVTKCEKDPIVEKNEKVEIGNTKFRECEKIKQGQQLELF